MRSVGKTHIGRIRANNEDSILVKNSPQGTLPNIFIVADGMGGHKAGEVASSLAIENFCKYAESCLENFCKCTENCDGGEILDTLISAVVYANEKVFMFSESDERYYNMGTTFTCCSVSGNTAYIAHVGDSRAYRIGRGEINQITSDHSFVAEMVKAGKLTPEEAENHPDRNIITRALGTLYDVKVDGSIVNVANEDMLLLCSDGLNTMLSDSEILSVVTDSALNTEQKVDRLVDMANEKGGRDNISVILIDLREVDNQ